MYRLKVDTIPSKNDFKTPLFNFHPLSGMRGYFHHFKCLKSLYFNFYSLNHQFHNCFHHPHINLSVNSFTNLYSFVSP